MILYNFYFKFSAFGSNETWSLKRMFWNGMAADQFKPDEIAAGVKKVDSLFFENLFCKGNQQ